MKNHTVVLGADIPGARNYKTVRGAQNYIDRVDKTLDFLGVVAVQSTPENNIFLEELINTHPRTKKLSFRCIGPTLENAIHENNEEVSTWERGILQIGESNTYVKLIETLHELKMYLGVRKDVYIDGVGHLLPENVNPKALASGIEFDKYDIGAPYFLDMSGQIKYAIILTKNGTKFNCAGGGRAIQAVRCPLEEGICQTPYKNGKVQFKKGDHFNLNSFREMAIQPVEISRLIHSGSGSRKAALELTRYLVKMTDDNSFFFFTSLEAQFSFYRGLGAKPIGPVIDYPLEGDWTPFILDKVAGKHGLANDQQRKLLTNAVYQKLPFDKQNFLKYVNMPVQHIERI